MDIIRYTDYTLKIREVSYLYLIISHNTTMFFIRYVVVVLKIDLPFQNIIRILKWDNSMTKINPESFKYIMWECFISCGNDLNPVRVSLLQGASVPGIPNVFNLLITFFTELLICSDFIKINLI